LLVTYCRRNFCRRSARLTCILIFFLFLILLPLYRLVLDKQQNLLHVVTQTQDNLHVPITSLPALINSIFSFPFHSRTTLTNTKPIPRGSCAQFLSFILALFFVTYITSIQSLSLAPLRLPYCTKITLADKVVCMYIRQPSYSDQLTVRHCLGRKCKNRK
jgi:membrane protease YdiL (CAAX protease family)